MEKEDFELKSDYEYERLEILESILEEEDDLERDLLDGGIKGDRYSQRKKELEEENI